MTSSSIIVVPSIGAIRPFADFVSASVVFNAAIRFDGKVPSKSGQPYGVDTTLEITAESVIELRDVDGDGAPIIQSYPLATSSHKILLNSATTLSALNTITVAAAPSGFLADDISENPETPAVPVPPSLSFGDSPLFNEYVLAAQPEGFRDQIIKIVKNVEFYFQMQEEAEKLRNGVTQIGEEGQAVNPNAAKLAEIDHALGQNAAAHEQRRQNVLKFINRDYLVLTAEGFTVTRPDFVRVSKDAGGKEKKEKVAATPADNFQPQSFKAAISNFIEDVVKHESFKITADVTKFIDSTVANLVNAVKVQ